MYAAPSDTMPVYDSTPNSTYVVYRNFTDKYASGDQIKNLTIFNQVEPLHIVSERFQTGVPAGVKGVTLHELRDKIQWCLTDKVDLVGRVGIRAIKGFYRHEDLEECQIPRHTIVFVDNCHIKVVEDDAGELEIKKQDFRDIANYDFKEIVKFITGIAGKRGATDVDCTELLKDAKTIVTTDKQFILKKLSSRGIQERIDNMWEVVDSVYTNFEERGWLKKDKNSCFGWVETEMGHVVSAKRDRESGDSSVAGSKKTKVDN